MKDETSDRDSRGGYGQPRDVDWSGERDGPEDGGEGDAGTDERAPDGDGEDADEMEGDGDDEDEEERSDEPGGSPGNPLAGPDPGSTRPERLEVPPEAVSDRDRLAPHPPSQRPADAHPDVVERC